MQRKVMIPGVSHFIPWLNEDMICGLTVCITEPNYLISTPEKDKTIIFTWLQILWLFTNVHLNHCRLPSQCYHLKLERNGHFKKWINIKKVQCKTGSTVDKCHLHSRTMVDN
jgi:hypothetical protein